MESKLFLWSIYVDRWWRFRPPPVKIKHWAKESVQNTMKYSIRAVSKQPVMSEGELLARVAAFEQIHDALVKGCDASALEVCENLQELKARIAAKDPTVNSIISSRPELVDMLKESKSVEGFMARIDNEIAAVQEAFIKDWFYDGIISAIRHRKDVLLEHLKPLIPQLIKQVEEADEKKFGEWKVFRQISVYSKYLPDQNQFGKAAQALASAAKYLTGVNPNKFETDKFKACFNGSVYMDKNGNVGGKVTLGTKWLGTNDIRKRGWTAKNHFLDALKQMQLLVDAMEKLSVALEKNKTVKIDEGNKDIAKDCAKATTLTINLIGHLGRGITSAASKISGSVWKRLFTNEK